MKTCFLYRDDLKAYSDSELSPLRRTLIRRHLTHCASCQEEMNFMTQVTEDIRATEPEEALSPALREKLLAEPAADASEIGAATPAFKPPVRRKRPLPAWTYAAVAVVAWFVCYPVFQKMHMQQAPMTSSVTASAMAGRARTQGKRTASVPAPVQGVRVVNRPLPPDVPSPAPMLAERPVMPAMVPPPPPKLKMMARASAPEAPTGSPVVYGNFGSEKPNLNSINGAVNDLNGDPDSLRQVHKEASIGLRVPDPDATGDKLNDMVKETGGYVAANNLTTGDDGRKSGELIVKVPEVQFETFLAAVAKLGTVVSKNITGQDITEQTSDAHEAQAVEESDLTQAEARLKALGSHAKWEDKEDTQDQRVKLAQTRARLKMLKRMAALGTLTIDLSETPKSAGAVPAATGLSGMMRTTTHDALESLTGSAAALLALVIWLVAYSPIWVPLLLLGRYALKEYKKREAV